MNTLIRTSSAVLLIAIAAGCGTRQERCAAAFGAMEKKSIADYKKANDPVTAIAVLEAYLANVDWSEKHGLKATSAPNLRFWAEARLPELYEAIGNSEKAKEYMNLARQHSNGTLQHVQHSATTNLMTADEIREFVKTFDAKRQPKWREKESPTKKSTVL